MSSFTEFPVTMNHSRVSDFDTVDILYADISRWLPNVRNPCGAWSVGGHGMRTETLASGHAFRCVVGFPRGACKPKDERACVTIFPSRADQRRSG